MRVFVLLSLFAAASAQAGISAHDIMVKNEQARRFHDLTSKATLEVGGGHRKPSTKAFTWWRKLSSDAVHFNSLTRFHSPPEVRDEAILFLEKSDGSNEILLYLPAFKKTRRVEVQQQSSSFMGSDFSYSDITAMHADDYKHELLKDAPCPDKEKSGACYVIQSVPANDDVRERTHYSKVVSWIRKDCMMAAQAEYYDPNGKLVKRLSVSGTHLVDPKAGVYFSDRLSMSNLTNGQFTKIGFDSVRVDKGMDDAIFSKSSLGQGD